MRRSGLRHGMAVTVAVVALSLVTAVGASAQGVDEPSPTIATTEPEVPVERSEEMSATETRLRTIVLALAGLGGIVVVCTAIFWKVTRPPRRSDIEETLPGDVTPLLPPVAESPPPESTTAPVAVATSAMTPAEQAPSTPEPPAVDPVVAAAPVIPTAPPPEPAASGPAVAAPEVTSPSAADVDPEALDAARSLFDRLAGVPDMDQ